MKLNLKEIEAEKYIFFAFILSLMLVLVSCSLIDSAYNTPKKVDNITKNETLVCPVIDCLKVECGDLDKIGFFYAQDSLSQLRNFIRYSNDFLYCEIYDIRDEGTAILLNDRRINVAAVKLIMSYDLFENGVPNEKSQYNFLFSQGLDITRSDEIITNYCVNENGVYMFNFIPDSNLTYNKNYYGIYLESNKSIEVFKNGFAKNWER